MSNTGQAALTIVGTVVGAYFGNPQLGFFLGSLAGSFLFPTQLPALQGPRLADISQTSATVGAPIPRLWGRGPIPGNIIYQSDLREIVTSSDVGGKGGPTQSVEAVSYYQDFAIGLSDRPKSRASAIKGIRRIQANGKWIYDIRPQQTGEADDAYSSRVAANAALDEQMTIYFGTVDQLPDPTMEAEIGVGQVQGYRDRAYAMFHDWFLKPEDGNRIPAQWLFECFTEGDLDSSVGTEWTNEVLYPWQADSNPLNPLNDHIYTVHGTGQTGRTYHTPGWDNLTQALNEGATFQGNSSAGLIFCGHGLIGGLGDLPLATSTMGGSSAAGTNAIKICLHYNKQAPTRAVSEATIEASAEVGTCGHFNFLFVTSGDKSPVHTNDFGFFGSDSYHSVVATQPGFSPGATPDGWDGQTDDCFEAGGPYNYIQSWDVEIFCERVTRAPDNPCLPRVGLLPPHIPGAENFAVVDGKVTLCGDWEKVTGGSFKVLQSYSTFPTFTYPLGPALPVGDSRDTEEFWTDAYEAAVANGDLPPGAVYGVDYPDTQGFAYRRSLDYSTANTDLVSIATILRDNFLEAGLAETDFDVSSLDTTFVIGFIRTRPMTARAVAESLRPVGFFDVVESGGKLKCVKRGGAIVATLKEEDLAARDSDQPVTVITSTKKLEMQIPSVVRVHFISDDQDLQPDSVPSPVTYEADADSPLDVEIVVVMSSADGRRIAEGLWADFRQSANAHQATVDQSFDRLEPADPLAIPLNGRLERMRILGIDGRTTGVRSLQLLREEEGTELGAAIGRTVPVVPPVVSVVSPIEVLLLDLPLLREQDDDPGFYAAARPYITASTFRGAHVLRSIDDGGSFSIAGGIGTVGTIGVLLQPAPAGPPEVWDDSGEIILNLQSGTLESRTASDVLNGANAAAIGADGRWEIVQFRDVAHITGTIFSLSGLLHGRRGTERVIGTAVKGDRFVLLSTGAIGRISLPLQAVGREYQYKCVGSGVSTNSADPILFTGRGLALKPFSPVALAGAHGDDGGWNLSWIRRSRFGEAWPDYTDVPLAEEREDYEVDILDGVDVVRTISVSDPSTVYSIDQQRADFGIGQANLSIAVYQISTAVGRGEGASANVIVSIPSAYEFMFVERTSVSFTSGGAGSRVPFVFRDAGSYVLVLDNGAGNVTCRRHPSISRLIDTADSLAAVGLASTGYPMSAVMLSGVTFVTTRDLITGRTKLSRVSADTTTVTHTNTSGGVSLDFEQVTTDGTYLYLVYDDNVNKHSPADLTFISAVAYVPPVAETPAPPVEWNTIDTLTIGAWTYAGYVIPGDSRLFVRRYSASTGAADASFVVSDVGHNSFGQRRPFLTAHDQYLGIGPQVPATVLDTASLTLYREPS